MSTEREIHARFVSMRDEEKIQFNLHNTRPATTPSYKQYVMVRVYMGLQK